MKKVFVSRRLPKESLQQLAGHCELDIWEGSEAVPREVLLSRAADADGIICVLTEKIDAELLANCPNLSAVSTVSVGVDHVDVAAMNARGIPLGHTPGVLVDATADLAFGLLLAVARRIPESDRYVQSGEWSGSGWSPKSFLGADISGKTLGIIGLGAIGQAVVKRAAGFGMRVIAWNRSERQVSGVENCTFDELIRVSDFVSINVALNQDTKNLIDDATIRKMKAGAILINTARGGIVNESALAKALTEGRLAGAGTDVFEQEPVPADNPLLTAPNFVAVPHIGSATPATRVAMIELAVANMSAAMEGKPMPRCYNHQVYK